MYRRAINCTEFQFHTILKIVLPFPSRGSPEYSATLFANDFFTLGTLRNSFIRPSPPLTGRSVACARELEESVAVVKVVVAAPTSTKVVRSRRVHLSDQMASLGKEVSS